MFEPIYHISDEVLGLIADIEAMRAQAAAYHLLPERQAELRYRATVEATHSSTSIEGNPLSLRQVEAVLSDDSLRSGAASLEQGGALQTLGDGQASRGQAVGPQASLSRHRYAEIEVSNYKAALDFVSRQAERLQELRAEDILAVHRLLMTGLLDPEKTGVWRSGDVFIVGDNEEAIYDGPAAEIVSQEVDELLAWLNEKADKVHPVIAAAILHYQLVSIHPFADGNGRTARVVTALYLAMRKYDFDGSLVLDTYYSSDRQSYYQALHAVQGDSYQIASNADLSTWVTYFTEGFRSSASVMLAEVALLSIISDWLPARQSISRDDMALLLYMAQFGSITTSEAEAILPQVSRRTIQRRLRSLVEAGIIQAVGTTRDRRYILG